MHIGYIGNFDPPHSTENHVAQALRALDHEVRPLQENKVDNWYGLAGGAMDYDAILWTRTGWDWPGYGIAHHDAHALQRRMLDEAKTRGVPTVAFHLDRWWGLPRQVEVRAEPFFSCSLVVTADGGHDDEWKTAGVNHVWLPPAVSEFECAPAEPDPRLTSDLAFVGAWNSYHPEWRHRFELVEWLRNNYGARVRFWPEIGQEAVRGEPLRRLYASTKINVGDSCLLSGATRYWSDRVPETLGRGGFLIHPAVDGLEEHFKIGEHLVTWPIGDWGLLRSKLDHYLEHDDERREIAAAGRAHVLANHTYTVRMRQVLEML